MSCAKIIKKIRNVLLLEQGELAKIIGVSKSSVSKYEDGSVLPRKPVLRKIKQLADKNNIKIKMEDLIERNE